MCASFSFDHLRKSIAEQRNIAPWPRDHSTGKAMLENEKRKSRWAWEHSPLILGLGCLGKDFRKFKAARAI